jgi:hypothetical protein
LERLAQPDNNARESKAASMKHNFLLLNMINPPFDE